MNIILLLAGSSIGVYVNRYIRHSSLPAYDGKKTRIRIRTTRIRIRNPPLSVKSVICIILIYIDQKKLEDYNFLNCIDVLGRIRNCFKVDPDFVIFFRIRIRLFRIPIRILCYSYFSPVSEPFPVIFNPNTRPCLNRI